MEHSSGTTAKSSRFVLAGNIPSLLHVIVILRTHLQAAINKVSVLSSCSTMECRILLICIAILANDRYLLPKKRWRVLLSCIRPSYCPLCIKSFSIRMRPPATSLCSFPGSEKAGKPIDISVLSQLCFSILSFSSL